jgi:hypothetical protein
MVGEYTDANVNTIVELGAGRKTVEFAMKQDASIPKYP